SEGIVAENLALEDPNLDAADAISGVRLGLRVIDVAAQGVQRNPAFAVPFGAGDLGAAEATRAGDANAFRAETQRRLNRALHRATERNSALELVGDALGDELGVDLRLTDLDDVQAHLGTRHVRQLFLELLD